MNQYGFGVLKAQPYQKGFGVYRARKGRRQKGHGIGSALMSIGRTIVPKILPIAKRVGKGVMRQGIKNLPALLNAQNKKAAARALARNIGKQALSTVLGEVVGGGKPRRRGRRERSASGGRNPPRHQRQGSAPPRRRKRKRTHRRWRR